MEKHQGTVCKSTCSALEHSSVKVCLVRSCCDVIVEYNTFPLAYVAKGWVDLVKTLLKS